MSRRTYTVRPHDTLSKIAERELGAANRWQEIARLNRLRNPDLITAGQELLLPNHSLKGIKGGRCNITTCQSSNDVRWFNHSTKLYYCWSCATKLNLANPDAVGLYGHPLCTRLPGDRGPFKAIQGSESKHCCFEATVVDDAGKIVCETMDEDDARIIAAALNAFNQT